LAEAKHRLQLRKGATDVLDVLKASASAFLTDRAKRLSAGLAFYALFALIPSVLLAVAIAAAFVGKEAAAGGLTDQLTDVFGADAAREMEQAIASVWESNDGSNFALFSLGVILFSASVLFVAWRDSVELIWQVPYEASLETSLRARAFAVLVPVCAGLILVATMILQGLVTFAQDLVSGELVDAAIRTASAFGQFLIGVAALGALYRYSARGRRPEWRDILPASILIVAVLAIGFWGYGVYIRYFGSASATGAASSVVLGLVIVYYSAQALLFGAEIVKVLDQQRSAD
jgi:membrane protein